MNVWNKGVMIPMEGSWSTLRETCNNVVLVWLPQKEKLLSLWHKLEAQKIVLNIHALKNVSYFSMSVFIWVVRALWQWKVILLSPGIWCHVFWQVTNVHLMMEAVSFSKTLVTTYQTKRCHIPEKLKSQLCFLFNGYRVIFPQRKMAGAWSQPLTSI
jgi:hypothetical protein